MTYKPTLRWSDVTPQALFVNRRQIMAGAAALLATPALGKSPYSTDDAPNTLEEISGYNNYYEFGMGKEDPAANAGMLQTKPWTVKVDGMVDKPGTYDLGDLISGMPIEERIYHFRCVEAWSMIIPWQGFQLSALLDKLGVQSGAKYVGFETLLRPEEMPGQKMGTLDWPYVEGLRLDEAMHPPDPDRHRPVRPTPAQPERRADPVGGAVEIWLQEHQSDCAHHADRFPARLHMEPDRAAGIRLLRQREPAG